MECARLDERAVGLEGHPVKSSACAIVVYGDGTGKLKKSCHGKHLNLDSVQAMSSRTTQFHEERGSHHAPPFSAWLSNLVVLRLCVVRWRKTPPRLPNLPAHESEHSIPNRCWNGRCCRKNAGWM